MSSERLKVWFPTGLAAPQTEGMWVTLIELTEGTLENIPVFARGVSMGDTVAIGPVDEVPTFLGVTRSGGHSTVHVVRRGTERADASFDALRASLAEVGCGVEQGTWKHFGVDVPPNVRPRVLEAILEDGYQAELIWYEVVAGPLIDPHAWQ